MKTMTVFGVGPKLALFTLGYGIAATWISIEYSILRIPVKYSAITLALGIGLVAVGLPFYAVAGHTIVKGFPKGELLTSGVYGICRHPVYGSWIVFVIPGVELLCRTWLGLTTSIVGYVLLRFMARSEESYLCARFGDSYTAYRRRVPFVLPLGTLFSRKQTD